MNKKYFTKIFIASFILIFSLGLILPARAFYLEIPRSLQAFRAPKKTQNTVIFTQTTDGSSGDVAPIPTAPPDTITTPQPTAPQQPITQPQQPMDNQQPQQPQPQQQNQQFDSGNQMGPQDQQGPSEEQQKQQQERQMKDAQRGVRQMGTNIKQLERMFLNAEKKGIVIPQEIKDKLKKAAAIIAAMQNATTAEELQSSGMDEIGDIMQDLDEARRTLIEDGQRLQDMKKGMAGLERGLVMFEKQIAKLTKQNIAVPSGLTDNLAKIKIILAAVKAAKTMEEAQSAGIDDLQDLMQNIDESRNQLEMLSRWPQTLKQIDRDLKQFAASLKRSKTMVNSLLKKGIDLSSVYSDFESAINKLKTVRDDAAAKMSSGDSEGAFDALENDFFGQIEDAWQYQKTIEMMSNLDRFTSDLKRGLAQAQQIINKLNKQKIDTSELQVLFDQTKSKGNEVLALLKVKPLDEETIMAGMEELWNLKEEFESKVAELTGEEETMPWETGQKQFQQLSMPSGLQKMIPQKQNSPAPQCAPGTTCDGSGSNTTAP